MQNRYTGDIGDFGKLGLLRALRSEGLSVGVNWYLVPDETHNGDGRHTGYLAEERYTRCDEALSLELNRILASGDRRVSALEAESILQATFFSEELSFKGKTRIDRERLRESWHASALEALARVDIVFLDPDNGLNVKSVKQGSQKSVKYVWLDEITDYISNRKSVIFYNHRPRKKAAAYFSEYAARLAPIGRPVYALTFPRRSIRDYFIIPTSSAHKAQILEALHSLKDGPFGKTGFCCLHPIPVCAVDDLP